MTDRVRLSHQNPVKYRRFIPFLFTTLVSRCRFFMSFVPLRGLLAPWGS